MKIGIVPEIIFSTNEENAVLERLDKQYASVVELSESERRFLNSLLLRLKPRRCLEIGASAGGSAVMILNALKEFNGKLVSVDYNNYWYRQGISDDYPVKNKKLCNGGGGAPGPCRAYDG